MNRLEVATLLCRAKLYSGFAHHPEGDRDPREAVMSGCFVVTGVRGSARFDEDVPLPAELTLDEADPAFRDRFRLVVDQVFADLPRFAASVEEYRTLIGEEHAALSAQVSRLPSMRRALWSN